MRAEGRELIDLGAGEPDAASPPPAVDAAIDALRSGFTRYTAVDGLADLRRELALHYASLGGPWTGEGDVLITVGAKSALLNLTLAVAEPGCEVIIPSPCWVSLPAQVKLAGATPVLVRRSADDGFAFDVDQLLAAFTDRTRLVVLNTPCNPTGAVLPTSELERLVAGAAQRDVLVVVDATYERFDYSAASDSSAHPVSVARRFPDHLAHVSSFSKAYAMTGWRVGFALGPPDLVRAMRMVQSHATTHATSFAMCGALAALRHGDEAAATLVQRCRTNRDFLVPALDAIDGVRCPLPEGSFYALADVRGLLGDGVADSTAFAERLLEVEGVVVVPGLAFDAEGFVRLSFAAPQEVVRRGLEGFRRFADSLRRPAAERSKTRGADLVGSH